MRLLMLLLGAFALVVYALVVTGCAAETPALRVVKRSFAGCTVERDGRQQCCFAAGDEPPVCVWTVTPRRALRLTGVERTRR
jgi:hypothetical protein